MSEAVLQWGFAGPILFVVAGMAILIGGGEILIRGAVRLAVALKIPSIIVGLTVVAFGTSAPELAVSLSAALKGSADLAVGNVVGSNICNIGLILGMAAILSPMTVSQTLIRREIPLMISLTILMFVLPILGANMPITSFFFKQCEGFFPPWSGGALVFLLLVYVGWTIYALRGTQKNNADVQEHSAHIATGNKQLFGCMVMIIVGIILLVLGSDLMVQGSVQIARLVGVSELVIGLTILAVGTSLPELIVSMMAAFHGKSDIALGNVIGSNIFNILAVLGITAMFSGSTAAGGLVVTAQALQFDMPVMLGISLVCMVVCSTKRRISRGEGFFLLLCYAAYLTTLCLMSVK